MVSPTFNDVLELKQTHSFACIYMFAPLGPSGSALAAAVCAAAAPASMKLIAPDARFGLGDSSPDAAPSFASSFSFASATD